MAAINIVPINDVKAHIPFHECPCNPTMKVVNFQIIITHNSFDGRECVEQAKEILKN